MSSPTVLVLRGYGDSGPDHWQTLWERQFGYTRVVQDDWEHPERGAWVAALDAAVGQVVGAVALVAHSLGCALVAHWAGRGATARVVGALLVAPPDVDEVRHVIPEVESFAPVPLVRLPFLSIVVASATDPYVESARARAFADAWGSRLVELEDAGHVNSESGLGAWAEGHRLLEEMIGADRPHSV